MMGSQCLEIPQTCRNEIRDTAYREFMRSTSLLLSASLLTLPSLALAGNPNTTIPLKTRVENATELVRGALQGMQSDATFAVDFKSRRGTARGPMRPSGSATQLTHRRRCNGHGSTLPQG